MRAHDICKAAVPVLTVRPTMALRVAQFNILGRRMAGTMWFHYARDFLPKYFANSCRGLRRASCYHSFTRLAAKCVADYRSRRLAMKLNLPLDVARLHEETPLVPSEHLSEHLGAEVFLKMDCWQRPGSFKIRGIGRTVGLAVAAGAQHVVTSSGGNAGLAAAYAAKRLGVPATVVLPSTTPAAVHERLRRYGAEVVVHGDVWDEADVRAQQLVEELKGSYVHPFDQPSTWEGHASLVEELARQLPRPPDAIVTCVGGGGLLMGILQGLSAAGWLDTTRVVFGETQGASSMSQSLAAGELVTLPSIDSVAKSLGAKRVSRAAFDRCVELGPARVLPAVTTDAAAVAACLKLAEHHRALVEPACGAALAAVTERSAALAGCRTVVVEVCGGAIVDVPSLNAWARDLGL
ncbi:unnamed protein product [Prorocentrum cordatum]|uniref:L-serine ammonia-lyase n=1 Tax=Prorocentrum cordatum TaxID=2364126 RepID=A0ABN9UGJ0_9DINO|nr:unnamed protein product [Polarella glacialis]